MRIKDRGARNKSERIKERIRIRESGGGRREERGKGKKGRFDNKYKRKTY